MAEARPSSVVDVVHPSVQYERDDVSFRGILVFTCWLVVALVAIYIGLLWLFNANLRSQPVSALPSTLLTPDTAARVPPEPRLQISPRRDMEELRAAENTVLQGYGWMDQDAGIARVPIERAMEMLAAQGLPPEENRTRDTK